jgi:hypothetical protein
MNNNRLVWLFCLLGLVGAVAAGGWAVGSRIESPAEAAARTAPPTPSLILVPIEERVLSSQIVTRGTARFGLPKEIAIAPSALKGNAASLITTLPLPNAAVKEGDVLFVASGRPVFVLQGNLPAYRDLVPGVSGNDVRQLEDALKRLGFDPGPLDGTFDEETSDAVADWYEAAEHKPFWPTAEQLANIRTLEESLEDARKAKMAADSAAASAKLGVDAARNRALHADKAAEAEIQAGIAERALVAVDPRGLATSRAAADAKVEVGRAALKAARTEGEMNYRAALEALKLAEFEANLSAVRADRIATELDRAKRKLGVQVPVDEIVFLPTLPVRVNELSVPIGAQASGPVLTVTDNKIVIDASLPLDAAALVKKGMPVEIDEQSLGIKASGIVDMVAETPGTNGVDGYHMYCAIRVDQATVPLQGFSLRLTIPTQKSKQAVTSVPTSALTLAADGRSRVQVEDGGSYKYVIVEPGMAADGYVEVRPLEGVLKAGQMVVVGNANRQGPEPRQ